MGAVDVSIGHHDDLVVAQVFLAIAVAGAAAQGLDEVRDQLAGGHLLATGPGHIEDLAA
ncbi:hypothetical protein D3C72_2543200 [compost metagenome]